MRDEELVAEGACITREECSQYTWNAYAPPGGGIMRKSSSRCIRMRCEGNNMREGFFMASLFVALLVVGCDPASRVTTTIEFPLNDGQLTKLRASVLERERDEALSIVDRILTEHGFKHVEEAESEQSKPGENTRCYEGYYTRPPPPWSPFEGSTLRVWCYVRWNTQDDSLAVEFWEFPAWSVSSLATETQRDLERALERTFGPDTLTTDINAVFE
jgi:hypothetical protein